MLLGGANIRGLIQEYRLCWICGRFSGGKTSLAYALAYEWLRKGYRLVTTNASVWADDMDQVKLIWPDGPDASPRLRTVCILDEGGLYFKASAQIEQVAAFAAKMDCIYLIPSFFPPVRAAQVVTVQPIFGLRAAGIPLIVYQWRTKIQGFDDRGLFYWWRPSEVYGVYSRQDPGSEPDEVVDWLITRSDEYQQWYADRHNRKRQRGRRNGLQSVAISGGAFGASGSDFLRDAATEIADAADEFARASALPKRGRRRK